MTTNDEEEYGPWCDDIGVEHDRPRLGGAVVTALVGARIRALSEWIDAGNASLTPEHLMWVRVAKIAEEVGEAIDALVGYEGSNPRKGVYDTREHLVKELFDVALTGLLAAEHVLGNQGDAFGQFVEHVGASLERVGLEIS